MSRRNPLDVLVASSVPGTEQALAAGHELYPLWKRVQTLISRRDNSKAVAFRQLHAEKAAEAIRRRDDVERHYLAALERVRAVSPATAGHVENAVWRAYLGGYR